MTRIPSRGLSPGVVVSIKVRKYTITPHHQHHGVLFLVFFVRKSSKEKVSSIIHKILKTLSIKHLVFLKLLAKFKCKNCQVETAPADKEAREDFNKFVREILDQNTNHGGQSCAAAD